MCSWKLGHRAVRFIINAASGLVNYGCSHNLVYKGEAHCSLWCSCEGLYSPGCITQTSDFYHSKINSKVASSLKKGVNLIRECIDGSGRAVQGTDTHPKVSWMNIYVCISYASLQQTAGKHLGRMLMKQTNSPSPTAALDSAWFPLFTLTINPAHSTLPSVLSFHLSSHFHIPSLPLSIIFAAPLLLPHCVLRPEDTDPHGRLWWFHPSSWAPHTWMTSLCLNHPLISTAGGAVHLKPAPILRDRSLLTCYFLHVLATITT